MNHVKAYGKFVEQNGYSHRTAAYLQWGTSEKSIGSFLLLNPGSSAPLNEKSSMPDESEFMEEELDSTMQQMVRIVESLYPGETLDGRISIYNLFSLRNVKSEQAIGEFEALVDRGLMDPLDVMQNIDMLKLNPWTCIGWGIQDQKKRKNIDSMKRRWMLALEEAGIPTFGKPHKNGKDYYHICPRLRKDQDKMLDELMGLYRKEVLCGIDV